MNFIEAIFLGILHGLTEFLPVSSSGQLVIFEHLLAINKNINDTVMKSFDVVLHAGTLLALLIIFKKEIINIFKFLIAFISGKKYQQNDKSLCINLIIGTIPGAFLGFWGADFLDQNFRKLIFVGLFLIITGILFLFTEYFFKNFKKQKTKIMSKNAFLIGIFQALAIVPGFSRSGFSICGALLQGIDKQIAIHFSFMLAIPIILGASLLSVIDIFKENFFNFLPLKIFLAGFIASFIISFLVAKLLLKFFRSIPLYFFSLFLFLEGLLIFYWEI